MARRVLQQALALAKTSVSAALQQSRIVHTSTTALAPIPIELEPYCRQRQIVLLGQRVPFVAPDAWLASNAILVGDVDLMDKVSIWYGCVLRGDLNNIFVDAWSNIQDRTVIHAARTSPTGLPAHVRIGKHVTIGAGCTLRSCVVEREVIVGARSILMEGSRVRQHSILLPGTVVPPGRMIPSNQMWGGNPAHFIRDLTKDEIEEIYHVAEHVFPLVDTHAEEDVEESFAYVDAEKVREQLRAFPAYRSYVVETPITRVGESIFVPDEEALK